MSDPLPCGCAGKTPLDRIVEPARERARPRLARRGVRLVGALDCGLLPRHDGFERRVISDTLDANSGGETGDTWALATVFAGARAGTSATAFADTLTQGYGALPADRLAVVKGHSVQVDGDGTTVAAELLSPHGTRRPGYVLGNVDAIHDFPELDRATVARIAVLHALNDCYAYGGADDRTVRPLVAAPAGGRVPDDVEPWFRDLPAGIDRLPPTVVRHSGRGWLFGATATADIDHSPPIHAGRLEPGDTVLLHRPLGAVAALAAARHGHADAEVRRRAIDALRTDHVAVGEAVAAASPRAGEMFDSDRHLKLATDVSGPGIGGVADAVSGRGRRLHVETLPFLDRAAVDRARDRWLVPDATLGTNGPVALVARRRVVERLERRLRRVGFDPVRIGRVVTGGGRVSTADGVALDRLIEDRRLEPGVTGDD